MIEVEESEEKGDECLLVGRGKESLKEAAGSRES